jgi:hypothetical protein
LTFDPEEYVGARFCRDGIGRGLEILVDLVIGLVSLEEGRFLPLSIAEAEYLLPQTRVFRARNA